MTRIIRTLLLIATLAAISHGKTSHENFLKSSSSSGFSSSSSSTLGNPDSHHLRRHAQQLVRRRLEEDARDEEEYEDALNQQNAGEIHPDSSADLQPGAHKAKLQYKAIDRHSAQRAIQLKQHLEQNLQHQQEYHQKYLKGQQGFARERAILDSRHHEHDQLTAKMKIHIPGTPEFLARQKALMDKVKSLQDPKQQKEDENKVILPITAGKADGVTMFKKNPQEKSANGFGAGMLRKKKNIQSFLAKHLPKPPANLLRRTVAKIPFLKRLHKPLSLEEEMILDASVSFFVHLETMVYYEPSLKTEAQMIALSDWLDLVSLSLPPEWHLHHLIDDLRNHFSYIAEGNDHLHEVLSNHTLSHKQWSHECTIDRGKFHVGFDCGFWKLLHIVTMGVAEQRGGMNLVQAEMVDPNTKTFSPLEAADIIRNLIKYYYNPEYSTAFVADYDDCNKHRRCDRLTDDKEGATVGDWKELPLWLWEVHNEIAAKALKKQTQKKHPEILKLTQEEEMKVIWPSVEQCHLCFQEDGTWNENEVFRYLEEHYW